MKMQICFALVLLSLGFRASGKEFETYAEWKNRPEERFGAAEESFKSAMEKILARYVDKSISKEDLYRAATAGMLASLNSGEHAWNTLLSPAEVKEIHADLSGQVSGIGIELKFDETSGYALVSRVIPKSPSEKAGVKSGDQILSVDNQRFKGKQFRDIVAAIRGKVGMPVALKILRDDSLIALKVKRGIVHWTPVELTKLDASTQLLTIGYFTSDTPKKVEEAVQAIHKAGTKRLIIDVRDNAGGGFEQAAQVTELFVPKDELIASTKDRDGAVRKITSKRGLFEKNIPIVILANKGTSSGAELFTAALRDSLGAKVVGENTLGKWNAQMIDTLENGFAIKYTVSSFESPKGFSYQDRGLKPDVSVSLPKDMTVNDMRVRTDIAKRMEVDTQLKAATELVRVM